MYWIDKAYQYLFHVGRDEPVLFARVLSRTILLIKQSATGDAVQYASYNANGELSEYAIHKTVMEWSRYNKQLAGYILHFPSEGKRSISFGARLKSLGMRKGVADLLIAMPRHGYHGAWIELKAVGGKVSKEQQAFLDDMKAMGYFTMTTYGLDHALNTIGWYCLEED